MLAHPALCIHALTAYRHAEGTYARRDIHLHTERHTKETFTWGEHTNKETYARKGHTHKKTHMEGHTRRDTHRERQIREGDIHMKETYT